MKQVLTLGIVLLFFTSFTVKSSPHILVNADKTIEVAFELSPEKTAVYRVFYKNKLVINTSQLGIIREDANFYSDLKVVAISKAKKVNDHYTMLQGKRKDISYSANQYIVSLVNAKGEPMDIIFQLSKDGVAFRYYFPSHTKDIKKIIEEKTTYNFDSTTKSWLQPMAKAKTGWKETNPSYEEHYAMGVSVYTQPEIGEGWVYPALFETNAAWVLLSETGLHDKYCGSRLVYNEKAQALQVTFPQKQEIFPNGALQPESVLPWRTPWRLITIGTLSTITESTLGTDLAEPAIKMDTSFIKGGLASWSWVLLKDESVNYAITRQFIDYAASMNWPYCLIDADWDTRIGVDKLKELVEYGKTKKVKLLVWYNSSGSWNGTEYHPKSKLLTPESRAAEFGRLKEIGIAGVKIDFFGGDGQSMIAYYHELLIATAKYQLLVNFHGATLPRGWQRTYPHLLTT